MKRKKMELSCEVLSNFCRQTAMLLKAGFSLQQSLELIREDSEDAREQELLKTLASRVDDQCPLAEAMEETKCYPAYLTRMVRLGEETGRLDDVLASLGDHYSREHSLRRSIRSAVLYPSLMLGMMLIVIVVLLTRVMPVFDQVFAQLGTRLTGLSRLLLELGQGIREYSLALAVTAAVIVLAIVWVRRQPKLTYALVRRIPWTRKLSEKVALCRFAGALSLALGSGLSTEYAMELAGELNEDPAFAGKLAQAREKMQEGQDMVQSLHDAGVLLGNHSRLALIGEKTGTVDAALGQIADVCREEADDAMASAVGLIEPVMVVVLSLVVGVLLMSVLFPMLGILASI